MNHIEAIKSNRNPQLNQYQFKKKKMNMIIADYLTQKENKGMIWYHSMSYVHVITIICLTLETVILLSYVSENDIHICRRKKKQN
jgi:hypothetical protein